jgi:hypothetical protein
MERIEYARVIKNDKNEYRISTGQELPIQDIDFIRCDGADIVLISSSSCDYSVRCRIDDGAKVFLSAPDKNSPGHIAEPKALAWA